MNFLFVSASYIPAYRYGGPIYSVHGLAKSLVAEGHKVTVLTTNVNGNEDSDVPLNRIVDMDGVEVIYHQVSLIRRIYYSASLRRTLENLVCHYDFVITQAVYLYPSVIAAYVARNKNIPYICTPRGMLVKELIAGKSGFVKTLWLNMFEKKVLAHAHAIHFTSELERRNYNELRMPNTPCFVLGNGVEKQQEKFANFANARKLIYLGRLSWKKNIGLLLDCMKVLRMEGYTLTIIGNDEEDIWPELKKSVRREKLEDHVKYYGPLYKKDKLEMFRQHGLFVTISINENFCNAALEAMSYGLPVVLGEQVGLSDEVAAAGAGTVVSNQVQEIVSAVRELSENQFVYMEKSRNAKNMVDERFTWSSIARNYVSHLCELVSEKSYMEKVKNKNVYEK